MVEETETGVYNYRKNRTKSRTQPRLNSNSTRIYTTTKAASSTFATETEDYFSLQDVHQEPSLYHYSNL